MTAKEFLTGIRGCPYHHPAQGSLVSSQHPEQPSNSDILYLQSQDGNIYRSEPREAGVSPELSALQDFFPRDIGWIKEATGTSELCLATSRFR